MDYASIAQLNGLTQVRAALAYGEMGFEIFPLWWVVEQNGARVCACGKAECSKPGKHPLGNLVPDGLKSASASPKRIEEWWRRYPQANIGMRTGVGSGVWALDVDVKSGGMESLGALEASVQASEPLRDATLRVRTGGGGWHLFWEYPQGRGVRTSAGQLLPGLDVRGEGGYVVLPPSGHESGSNYSWEHIRDASLAPEWLLEKVGEPTAEERAEARKKGKTLSTRAWQGGYIFEGRRNSVLYFTALSMLGKGFTKEAVSANLQAIDHQWCRPQLGEDEVLKVVESACAKDPGLHHSEAGLATWLSRNDSPHSMRGTYCWAVSGVSGDWLEYRNYCWTVASPWDIETVICTVIQHFYRLGKDNGDEVLWKWAQKMESQRSVEAVVRALRRELSVDAGLFSSEHNRHLLPLSDGKTIVLRRDGSWEARSSSHEDFLKGALPIRYDANASCPTWEKAISRWLEEDEARIEAMWRWMGALLTGERLFDKFILIVGDTRSGKTTFANSLQKLLGGYAIAMPIGVITKGRGANGLGMLEKERHKAGLFGRRLAVFSESATAAELDGELVKTLTGGDTVSGREMGRNPHTFVATHKMLLHTNHYPSDKGVDAATLARWMIYEWCGTIPENERDPYFDEKLVAESSGWLNRALRGYRSLCERGLGTPTRVAQAAEPYVQQSDVVKSWVEADCEVGSDLFEKNTSLLARHRKWCTSQQMTAVGKVDLYRSLQKLGFRKATLHGYPVFYGLKPRPEVSIGMEDLVLRHN